MTIQPVQDSSNQTSVHSLETSSPIPSGVSGVPDRLESSSQGEIQHPSQFKKFLFDPIASLIKWAFRSIFQFFDRLRGIAPDDRRPEWRLLKERIQAAPRAQELFFHFERHFEKEQREQIYQAMGEKYQFRLSWTELFWKRSREQNIAIGRQLVQKNPEVIRDQLVDKLSEVSS